MPHVDLTASPTVKTVYSFKENALSATVSWELNLCYTDLSVRSVELSLGTITTDGQIDWYLIGDGKVFKPIPGSSWKSDDLCGAKKLTLTAVMIGGKQPRLLTADTNTDEGTALRMEVKLQGGLTPASGKT